MRIKDPAVHVSVWWILETAKTPSMHLRLRSMTLLQLAFPGESNPYFPWEKSQWENTILLYNLQLIFLTLVTLEQGLLVSCFFLPSQPLGVTSGLNQCHQTWHEYVDPKQGCNHPKFERSCFNSVQEKANVKGFSNQEICKLSVSLE